MRGGAILADGLALALLDAQDIDDRRPEQEHEQQRRHDGAAGAEGDVAEHVQRPDLVAEAHQRVEHSSVSPQVGSETLPHRIHDGCHARSARPLDHHDVAALQVLELTERMLMDDLGEVKHRLLRLKALGLGIAVDDFGTGYSSLGHLKELPIDKIKIDRSFIHDLPGNRDSAAITRAVIGALG